MRIAAIALIVVALIIGFGLLMKVRPNPADSASDQSVSIGGGTTSAKGPEAETAGADSPKDLANALRGGAISGRVYDRRSGKGLAGITVVAYGHVGRRPDDGYKTTTDASGDYTLRGLEDDTYHFHPQDVAGSQDCLKMHKNVAVSNGATVTGMDFSVCEGTPLVGRVVGEDSRPIADATLHTSDSVSDKEIKTKADGSFMIENFPWDEPCYLLAEKGDLISEAYGPVTPGKDAAGEITMTLRAGGTIEGRVVDELGNPLSKIDVLAEFEVSDTFPWRFAKVDGSGNFQLKNVTSGLYRIEIRRSQPDLGAVEGALRLVFGRRGDDDVDDQYRRLLAPERMVLAKVNECVSGIVITSLELETNSLWGTVTSADGTPAKEARVRLSGGDQWIRSWKNGGEFRFDWLEQDPYLLTLSTQSFFEMWAVTELNRGVDLVVPVPARIEGQVVNGQTGEPVKRFEIARETAVPAKSSIGLYIRRVPEGRPDRAYVFLGDLDGRFTVADADTSDVAIHVRAPGYFHERVPLSPGGESATFEKVAARLTPCPPIEGKVLSPEGKPVMDAMVSVAEDGQASKTWTNAEGVFKLEGYPRDLAGLIINHPQFVCNRVKVNPATAVQEPILVRMDRGGTVRVHAIRGTDIFPEADARVVREGIPDGLSRQHIEPDGTIVLDNAPVGDNEVRVSLTREELMPYRTWHSRHVSVRQGETADVQLSVPEKPTTLSGKVLIGGRPAESGEVKADLLNPTEGEKVVGTSPIDAAGRYFLVNLPTGTYTLTATGKTEKGTPATSQQDVELAAGEDYALDIEIEE